MPFITRAVAKSKRRASFPLSLTERGKAERRSKRDLYLFASRDESSVAEEEDLSSSPTQDKTNLKYILIVVILALVVGAGILGYGRWIATEEAKLSGLLGFEQNEEETEKPFKPLNTEGWQTYRNEEHGFEFKYPAEWYDKPGETNEEAGRFYLFDSSFCGRSCQRENSNISFGIENNDALLSVSEWMKQNVATAGMEADEPLTIGGSQGIKRNYKGANNSTLAVLAVFPQKDKLNTLYYFETSGYENIKILNQILLDFRFLK